MPLLLIRGERLFTDHAGAAVSGHDSDCRRDKLRCGIHESAMNRKLVPHHSHWGAFSALFEDGKVVGAVPFDFDPDPSPLIDGIADAVHSPTRIACPMVRSGWLRDGKTSSQGRGREPFVPVSWERALELVAGELVRVRREHG